MGKEPGQGRVVPLSPGRGRHVEGLIMLATAVTLLPLVIYTVYLALAALHEGEKFRSASPLPDTGRLNGEFYKLSGLPTGTFLSPPAYPEVKDALLVKVSQAVRNTDGSGWTRTGTIVTERVDGLSIAGVPVALGEGSRILINPVTALRQEADGRRIEIESMPGAGTPLVAFGVYRDGRLVEGPLDRLIVTTAAREPEILEMIEKTGRIKATVLGVAAAALAVMAALAGASALRRRKS